MSLTAWRTVTVMAGGFPGPPHEFREGVLYEQPRSDWEAWHEIRHSERPYLARLRYGDYGILPAEYVSRTPRRRKGGPAWGVLRYTTARSYHLAKVPRGERYDDANRQAARSLTSLADFRGLGASAGERWLHDRARGATSTGDHGDRNRVGNVQHMTYARNSLSGPTY
ncbi:hypothetical protein GCM10010129_07840 [Streptomyces fumigatiscleroticus]|nr:hypothetical protein GCM10010129_07840 [Streptomyces fumigatiscleroticus]